MKIKVKSSSPIDSSLVYPIGMLGDYEDVIRHLLETSHGSREIQKFISAYTERSFHYFSDEQMQEFLTWPFPKISDRINDNASSSKVVPANNKTFRSKYERDFFATIQNTNFKAGEDNRATEMMSQLLAEEPEETLILLNDYFIEHYDDERLCVKILTLLNDYKYDELKPMGQTIALASISNKSSRVKSAAFNLFAHWACPEALKLLLQVEVPKQPWIAMKYNSVKESLEKKCSTQER